MKIKEEPNEHGTMTSFHVCDICGEEFTVTPAVEGNPGWENCMAMSCPSYDAARDIDAAFDSGDQLKQRDVVSLAALNLRRKVRRLE